MAFFAVSNNEEPWSLQEGIKYFVLIRESSTKLYRWRGYSDEYLWDDVIDEETLAII
jgi:hypothetical protein